MPASENIDPRAKYKRVILKLSGEVLRGGKSGDAIDGPTLERAGPLLGGILIAGVVIGIVQAATSIQEMTLSFVPKLIFIVVALLVIGNWQINLFVDYIERVFLLIPVMLQ